LLTKNLSIIAVITVLTIQLSGCATVSSNIREENSLSYRPISLNATIRGPVDASRCYRNTLRIEPTKDTLMTDLKIAAYAKGADAITNVTVNEKSGLLHNCGTS